MIPVSRLDVVGLLPGSENKTLPDEILYVFFFSCRVTWIQSGATGHMDRFLSASMDTMHFMAWATVFQTKDNRMMIRMKKKIYCHKRYIAVHSDLRKELERRCGNVVLFSSVGEKSNSTVISWVRTEGTKTSACGCEAQTTLTLTLSLSLNILSYAHRAHLESGTLGLIIKHRRRASAGGPQWAGVSFLSSFFFFDTKASPLESNRFQQELFRAFRLHG